MPQISASEDMPYDARTLYDLAMDTQSHPQMIKQIQAVRVRPIDENSHEAEVIARISFASLKYTCSVKGVPAESIAIRAIRGDFNRLSADIRFEPLDNGHTRVSCTLDFDLGWKNKLAKIFMNQYKDSILAGLRKYAAENLPKPATATAPPIDPAAP